MKQFKDESVFKAIEKLNSEAYSKNWKYLKTKKEIVCRSGRYVDVSVQLGDSGVQATRNNFYTVRTLGQTLYAGQLAPLELLKLLGIPFKSFLWADTLDSKSIEDQIDNNQNLTRDLKALIAKPRSKKSSKVFWRQSLKELARELKDLKKALKMVKAQDKIDNAFRRKQYKIEEIKRNKEFKVQQKKKALELKTNSDRLAFAEEQYILSRIAPDQALLRLEIKNQDDETVVLGNAPQASVAISPALDEGYWTYRVMVSKEQAIVGFPKFGITGIGFMVEDKDGNTNLPSTMDAGEIYNHIKVNKGKASIQKDKCLQAIELIKVAAEIGSYRSDDSITDELKKIETDLKANRPLPGIFDWIGRLEARMKRNVRLRQIAKAAKIELKESQI